MPHPVGEWATQFSGCSTITASTHLSRLACTAKVATPWSPGPPHTPHLDLRLQPCQLCQRLLRAPVTRPASRPPAGTQLSLQGRLVGLKPGHHLRGEGGVQGSGGWVQGPLKLPCAGGSEAGHAGVEDTGWKMMGCIVAGSRVQSQTYPSPSHTPASLTHLQQPLTPSYICPPQVHVQQRPAPPPTHTHACAHTHTHTHTHSHLSWSAPPHTHTPACPPPHTHTLPPAAGARDLPSASLAPCLQPAAGPPAQTGAHDAGGGGGAERGQGQGTQIRN